LLVGTLLSSEGKNKQTNKHGPPGNGGTAGTAGHEPLSADQVAVVALLTDPDVGMAPGPARQFAATPGLSFQRIAAHVFEWRRQLDTGVVHGVGALVKRLVNHQEFSAVVIAADRRTALWQRHMGAPGDELDADGESLAQLATRYVPAGYELPAGPLQRPDPEPEPGTPDHAWRQLAAELAQHLDGAALLEHDSERNRFLAAAPGHKVEWLNLRLAPQASRKLTIITGRPAAVQFIAQGD
jgi:hypothetical protein